MDNSAKEIVVQVVQQTNWVQIVTSVCSVIISAVAVIISITTYQSQKKHNRNSVRPILSIDSGDYEDNIFVCLCNYGVGPAIIKSIICSRGEVKKSTLAEFIPESVRISREQFEQSVGLFPPSDALLDWTGLVIPPGGQITLLRFSCINESQRIALRGILRDITIKVRYSNVYEENMRPLEHKLSFFGRTISGLDGEILSED